MKKIVISAIALVMSVAAMATQTAIVQIKLAGETGVVANSVYLIEDDAYTSAYESGADVEKLMSQANTNSVLMYGFVGTTPCEYVVTNILDGVKLGLTTNQVDVNYTLTFKNFSGRELKLYDAVLDSVITINASTPDYAFTATMGRVAVDDRFVMGDAPVIAYEICHRYGKLQVSGYKGGTVVVKDNTDTPVISVVVPTRTQYSIDLSALAAGQYKVEANGQTLIIDVQ